MSDALKAHIKKLIKTNEDLHANILPYFRPIEIKKKKNLLVEGKVCESNYFVAKGCLRMFFINEKGIEQTIQFALENWWLADYTSFSSQNPSGFYIQAVENSDVLALHFQAQEEMLQKFPAMERYFRLIHQRAHQASQQRMKIHNSLSKEEVYRQFVKNFPGFVQRVPQYLLASYLNLTPEYLSEIRSKKFS